AAAGGVAGVVRGGVGCTAGVGCPGSGWAGVAGGWRFSGRPARPVGSPARADGPASPTQRPTVPNNHLSLIGHSLSVVPQRLCGAGTYPGPTGAGGEGSRPRVGVHS